jgi:very-short-patch-repair endonuclease
MLGVVWEEIVERQHGVVSRWQALQDGQSPGAIRCRLRSGKWRRLSAGVYATFTGPVSRNAQLWAAVLAAGPDAMLSHESAAEVAGLCDEPADAIHVTVPAQRNFRPAPGLRRHLSIRAQRARHPTRLPPQTRVEETVVDLTQSAPDLPQAMNWAIRACARRLTTVDRLRDAFAARKKLRWRHELGVLLEDVQAGCHSLLELAYLRNVERRHGLPSANRQVVRIRRGGRWYDDVRYTEYRTAVELDGQVAHPAEARARDSLRDNAGVTDGLATLRYGGVDVLGSPCQIAQQVGAVLIRNGWRDKLRPCGPRCEILGGGVYPVGRRISAAARAFARAAP